MLKAIPALVCLGVSILSANVSAHHSFAAEFDYDAMGTIEGEVIEVIFVNPHARYFVSVTATEGDETIWDTQTRSVNALSRVGWDEETIRVGDKVRMHGNLGRDGARKLWIREVAKDSGPVIRPVADEDAP